jgi:hypothetical protein
VNYRHSTVLTQCHATAASEQITARTLNTVTPYNVVGGHQDVTRKTLTPSSVQKPNVVPTYQITRRHNAKTITQAYQHFLPELLVLSLMWKAEHTFVHLPPHPGPKSSEHGPNDSEAHPRPEICKANFSYQTSASTVHTGVDTELWRTGYFNNRFCL